jgi:hypothetical protein
VGAVDCLVRCLREGLERRAALGDTIEMTGSTGGRVVAVCRSIGHSFSKLPHDRIHLVAGLGVAHDAHAGQTVQHLSRVANDPAQANLRQVHLIHGELHDELARQGFLVAPGDMGENITTRGIRLLDLFRGTRLRLGREAIVEVTGLRNPCVQLDRFQTGLLKAVLDRDEEGKLVRKSGIMAIVIAGGDVEPGDPIGIELPVGHQPLAVV